jgi:hypothetical protein
MCGLCCSRRSFLTGILSTLVSANAITNVRADVPIACASLTQDPGLPSYPRRASSDNPSLDDAVIRELKKIMTIIPVNPEFHYIEENAPNAFAIPTSDVLGTKGTVLLGLKLLNSLLNENSDGAAAIAGICAHECAHIHQYFDISELYNRLLSVGVIAVELHADLIAGYYMGKRGDADANRVRSFSLALYSRTDYYYTDPNFHGAPGQRLAAVDTGYLWAKQGVPLDQACIRGEPYVKNLIGR